MYTNEIKELEDNIEILKKASTFLLHHFEKDIVDKLVEYIDKMEKKSMNLKMENNEEDLSLRKIKNLIQTVYNDYDLFCRTGELEMRFNEALSDDEQLKILDKSCITLASYVNQYDHLNRDTEMDIIKKLIKIEKDKRNG
jgi:hypothetical protein